MPPGAAAKQTQASDSASRLTAEAADLETRYERAQLGERGGSSNERTRHARCAALADACRAAGQEVQVVDEDSLHLTRNDSYKGTRGERRQIGKRVLCAASAAAIAACGGRRPAIAHPSLPCCAAADAASEKVARGAMLSAIDRCLGRRRTVIFDTQNGNLYFDRDGSGSGAAVLIGVLTPGTSLSATDFKIVDVI